MSLRSNSKWKLRNINSSNYNTSFQSHIYKENNFLVFLVLL